MPRLLKRDYNTSELLEIAEQLLEKAIKDRHTCYDAPSRMKNSIELAYHRQTIKALKAKDRQEKEEIAAQGGLF